MNCNCEGLGRTAELVHGMIMVAPCTCNTGDWETTRKPELERILQEAEARANEFNG
jgi:hypothetical protein